jgi:tetratricopeptide (TPR) repeat protein
MKIFKLLILFFIAGSIFAQDTTYNYIVKEFKKKNFRKIIELCKERIEKNPREPLPYAYMGFAYFSAAERRKVDIDKDALRQRGIKKGQTYLFTQSDKIQDFLTMKVEYDKDTLALAEQAMQKVITLQPKNFEFKLSLGQIFYAEGEHEKLIKLIDSLITGFPIETTAKALSRFGLDYFTAKNYQNALDVYRTIAWKFHEYAPAFSDAGTLFIIHGELDTAVKYLKHAVALDPADSLTLNSLSQSCLYLQKFDEAAEYKEKLLDKYPNTISTILDLAFLYSTFNREKSVQMFNKFLEYIKGTKDYKEWKDIFETLDNLRKKKDNYAEKMLILSEKLSGMGYPNYSIIALSKLLSIDKKNNPAYFDLAMLYRDINIYDKTLEYLTQCENLTSELARTREIVSVVYLEKAKTYLLMNDYNNMFKYAKLCLDKYKKNTGEIHYLLGIAYESRGKYADAENEFNEVIKLNDNEKIVEQSKVELQDMKIKKNR